MNEYSNRYKRPYTYNCKNIRDGIVEKIKILKSEGMTFAEIGNVVGKSRQRVSQIYNKSIAIGF